MIPIFLVFSSGKSLGMMLLLPAIMSEGFVGLRHLMGLLTFFNSCALTCRCVHQLVCQFFCHRSATTGTRGFDEPAHCQRIATIPAHIDRYLVSRATYTAWSHLDAWSGIFKRLLKDINR